MAAFLTPSEVRQALACRPKAIELFTGVGGLSLGLDQAGFHVALAVEIEEVTGRYAQYNLPATEVWYGAERGDVRAFTLDRIRGGQTRIVQDLTLVAGGPPCQGFSLAGKKDAADPLNTLVLEFARIVLDLQPLAFLMENVPGITQGASAHLAEAMRRLSERYRLSPPTALVACDYGVPQARERVFVLGFRRDLGITPSFPEPTHMRPSPGSPRLGFLEPCPTVRDALGDLPAVDDYPQLIDTDRIPYDKEPDCPYQRVMRGRVQLPDDLSVPVVWDSAICTNLRRTQHGPHLTARFKGLAFGAADKMSGIRRLDPAGVSTTIRAGTTKERGAWSAPRPLHPFQNRVLTTRECARIQSFPDWFMFHPTKWHGNRQVGNAVPPYLARAIAVHILRLLAVTPTGDVPLPVIRDDALVEKDITDAASAGLSQRHVSQVVQHFRRIQHTEESEPPMPTILPKQPIEFYGEPVTMPPSPQLLDAITSELCPFRSTRCMKTRKSDKHVTIGACVVAYKGVPVVICPHRFLQHQQVFLDCIPLLTATGRYLAIPEMNVPGGHVDFFLVAYENETVLDYVGIEFQAVDTTQTGAVWQARTDALSGRMSPPYLYGMNWKMSAKTILMQMHHKAATFEDAGKKLVLALQGNFLEYIEREFAATHVRNADRTDSVHFHAYDCVDLNGRLSLVRTKSLSTSAAGVEKLLGQSQKPSATDTELTSQILAAIRAGRAFEITMR